MNHETKLLNAVLQREFQGVVAAIKSLAIKEGITLEEFHDELKRIETVFATFKGDKGDNAIPPKLGVEYWTEEDKKVVRTQVRELVTSLVEKATPKKGKDYLTETEQKQFVAKILEQAPKKGRDFMTDEDVALIAKLASKHVLKAQEGMDFAKSKDIEAVKTEVKKDIEGVKKASESIIEKAVAAVLSQPARIARSLETLRTQRKGSSDPRLDASAVKNLPNQPGVGAGAQITVSATAPSGPYLNQLWMDIS